jgi:cellulose synthase/poly-beta-1,6-N-acetylglucosamine synthase-like glycosyltransferase
MKPDEIILVDSSNDRTPKIAKPFVDKIIFCEPISASYQRSIGVKNSTGDILLFTDMDTYLSPFWIERIVEKFKNSNVKIVRGSVLYREIKNKIPRKFTIVHHCNTAYRREVLDEIPFDPMLPYYADDRDMNERIKRKGYKVYGCPSAKVFHIGSFEKMSEKEKARRYAVGDAYLTWKHRSLFMIFRPFMNVLFSVFTEFRLKYNIYYLWFYLFGEA